MEGYEGMVCSGFFLVNCSFGREFLVVLLFILFNVALEDAGRY